MAFYGTEAAADTYLASNAAWLALTSAEKQSYLTRATLYLDQLTWQGHVVSDSQTLAWPRSNVFSRNGFLIDPDNVPTDIENASYELAALDLAGKSLFATSVTKDFTTSGGVSGSITEKKVTAGKGGGVEVTKKYSDRSSGTTFSTDRIEHDYPYVHALISQYLVAGGKSSRLVRY